MNKYKQDNNLNDIIYQIEQDLVKYLDKEIENKTRNLQQQLTDYVLNLSNKVHANNVKHLVSSLAGEATNKSFALNNRQMLNSLISELKNSIFEH